MKNLIYISIVLFSLKSFSQELDYCNYFTLEIRESEFHGKKLQSIQTVVLNSHKDKFNRFLKNHNNRFDYILFKNNVKFKEMASLYPDTIRIKNEYCNTVINSNEIQNYFISLTPNTIVAWKKVADTFSVNELMLVASRYFYCDEIDKKDTTIQSHICIGINGQNEFKSKRDFTILEAFSFEAIFSYMRSKKDPLFYTEFYNFKNKIAKEKITDFKDFESYLLEIRDLCYIEMQNNLDLKKKILNYYKKNRNNLNFIII